MTRLGAVCAINPPLGRAVPAAFVESLELPIPPIQEQREIVAKLREQLAVVDAARRAVTDRATAGEILGKASMRRTFATGEHDSIRKLGEVAEVIRGVTFD